MDRNIEMYQTFLRGYKLIIENHPFLGKRDVHWCYFPWSFFNKSLLGYPHSYAFQRAKIVDGKDPFDCKMLAEKVVLHTETTISKIYEDIKTVRIILNETIKEEYQELKKTLFATETLSYRIIYKLKKFINEKVPELGKGFDLLNLGRLHDRYLSGERSLFVSDAKVDVYLESEFWKSVNSANLFMESLWGCCGVK